MRLANLSTHRRAAIGMGSCIAWKVITGTVNIGFEKRETTHALKMSLAPLHGTRVTSPINANLTKKKTIIYRRHCKRLPVLSGAHSSNTVIRTRQIRTRQIRTRQIRTRQIRTRQIRTRQMRTRQKTEETVHHLKIKF